MAIHLYDSNDFGGDIDNKISLEAVKEYLRDRHTNWVKLDAQIMTEGNRLLLDERIHLVVYFISPHRLKKKDREFLLQLSSLAPVVPIVAKADTMTVSERNVFLQEISFHLVKLELEQGSSIIYDFGDPMDSQLSSDADISPSALMKTSFFTSDAAIHFDETMLDSSSDELDYEHKKEETIEEVISMAHEPEIFVLEDTSENEISSIAIETFRPKKVKNIFAVITDVSGLRKYPWGDVR